MEERLAQLKMQMGKERERRDAARGKNPSGSIWGSARTDVSTTTFAEKALEKGRKATPPVGGALAAARETRPLAERPLLAAPEPPPTTKPSNLAALLAGHQQPPQAPASFAQANQQQHARALQADVSGAAGGLGGGNGFDGASTKTAAFEWNPGASQSGFFGGGDNDYEDLLGPEEPQPPPPPQPPRPQRFGVGGMSGGATSSGGTSTGGALLVGTFDEDESAESFQEALRAFRGEPAQPPKNRGWERSEKEKQQQQQRAPRFQAPPQQQQANEQPTLNDKVHAIKTELGLPLDASMVEAVTAANKVVGLDSIGSLNDQVGRVLRETGIKPVRGCAPGAAVLPSKGGGAVDVSAEGASPPRPGSSHGGTQTQTQPQTSFYERFLEQKKKDGIAK